MLNDAPTPANPAALHKSLTALLDESGRLRSDVHTAEQARQRATRLNLGVLVLLVVLMVLLVAATMQTFALAHKVDNTNERIAECITPGGLCFEQGQQRTGEAISNIIRAQVFISECGRLYPGESGDVYDQKLANCVVTRLSGPTLRNPTSPTPTPSPSPTR